MPGPVAGIFGAGGVEALRDGLGAGVVLRDGRMGPELSFACSSGRAWAPCPSAEAQPTAANPVTLRMVSATRPPHSFVLGRRATAWVAPPRRRRLGERVALCAVMVVQVVIAM
ncbi:hypothetical protein GCM10022403_001170 [Streptomyces coacervatus]|uniref:Uncharacterized protein n=1 Tax=Streptomyces coacervatus TaxID=647381 RepID=A0ABP7GNA0_9ACTN